jgi:uncharacterized protein (TIGR03118 family)
LIRRAAEEVKKTLKLTLSCLALLCAFGVASAQFHQINLTSDGSVAAEHIDPNLMNPWGIAYNPTDPNAKFYVANNGAGLMNDYSTDGAPLQHDVVSMPPNGQNITGVVFNSSNHDFYVSNGTGTAPAKYIIVSEDGMISAYSPKLDATHAIRVWNNLVPNSYYTGADIGQLWTDRLLFGANFGQSRVDVFGSGWNLRDHFTDNQLVSAGYSPFNVKVVRGYVVVTFAKRDSATGEEVTGQGNGAVDIFTMQGKLIKRLVQPGGVLNAPWGIAYTPDQWGRFAKQLLIGNFGSGVVQRYNPDTGELMGYIPMMNGNPFQVDGLWSLDIRDVPVPGIGPNDHRTRPVLYFTAGLQSERGGLFGEVTFQDQQP